MNSIEKKLIEKSESNIVAKMPILEEMKMILNSDALEEKKLLMNMGLNRSIKHAEAVQEDIKIRTDKKDAYGKTIVHRSEIDKLCLDYRLYFKKANQYMGAIPNELGAEMLRYTREKSIAIGGDDGRSRFFIIAPPKMFEGYESPTAVLKASFKIAQELKEERIRPKEEDPILVYRLPGDENYFAVIKSWGNDFSVLRRIYGFFTKKSNLFMFDRLLNISMAIALLFLIPYFYSYPFVIKFGASSNPFFINLIVIEIPSLILLGIWQWNKYLVQIRRIVINRVISENEKLNNSLAYIDQGKKIN